MLIQSGNANWLAPYGYVLVGFILLCAALHLVLRFVQNRFDFLWYRQLVSWKKLSLSRKRILEENTFYNKLSPAYQKQFEHRVCCFIKDKQFKHRYETIVSEQQIVVISCMAVMLTFGRRNYLMEHLKIILLFDEPFESAANKNKHKGEYNPKASVLALSWPDVLKGIKISDDNFNLALHEFTHVIHIESERAQHIDALRYHKYHRKILLALVDKKLRENLERSRYFRMYAFTNQYEFMAVLTKYYFESPADLLQKFPKLYKLMETALLMKKEWIN